MDTEIVEKGKSMYMIVNVIKRTTDGLVIYRCLQRLSDGAYFVQSADRVRLPIRTESLQALENQFYELLIENEPDTRGEPAKTLESAIRAFDDHFAE